MKKCIFFLMALMAQAHLNAQSSKIDSLRKLLEYEKRDTARISLLNQLSYQYENSKPDSSLLLSEEGLSLAKKNNNAAGEIACLNMIGLAFMTTGNYPKALEYLLESLKRSEGINDRPSIATALVNIGVVYSSQGDYRQGVNYQLQAFPINKQLNRERNAAIILLDLGDNYDNLNILDSAIYYTNQCYTLSQQIKANDLIGIALNNFGNIYSKMGKQALALKYYRSDFPYLSEAADNDDFCETYLGMAKLFELTGKTDSCLYYAKLSLRIARIAGFTDEVMKSSNFLTTYYTSMHNVDSAFAYQSAAIVAKDSLFSQEKAREMQTLRFDEAIRQQQIQEAKEQAHTQLKLNLLAGGLGTFLIVAFLLYRNNRQKQKAFLVLVKQKKEINEQKQKVEQALTELKATQTQLIQSEKMASLGEITAGIAHEIQNPLNFVNNFSEISNELISEMMDEVDLKNTNEVKLIASNIRQNLEKINYHGKRADAIVKGMLQHSRSTTGIREPTNINALCGEYLRLAYHGLRAKDNSFTAKIETDFDENISKINVVPQDIGRVLLNVYNNAFYAVQQKQKQIAGSGESTLETLPVPYEPTISVSTRKSENKVLVSIRDNGNGIPQKVLDKIFQPFFTTKPTGQGTGLGLSMSYDIIKAHGSEIKVNTKEGEFTEFIIQLPL